jgi:hypothetical protein
MTSTRIFRHQGYELQCSAKAVDGNRFAPALVVTNQAWPRRPRVIAVERGEHLTEDAAIDAAFTQGVQWVTNYG